MSKSSEFCDADDGFDYIFSTMNAIYGAKFEANWQNVDPAIVRQVWKEKLGLFLTYRPSMDYALSRLDGDFPPSAIKFRDYCNAGPHVPRDELKLTHQQAAPVVTEEAKRKGLEELKSLRNKFKMR